MEICIRRSSLVQPTDVSKFAITHKFSIEFVNHHNDTSCFATQK
ncbi:hypothetical protein JM83_2911 [Gillisia sp. Hel_I_86]|nr:hypothetical protein JM83_2911 [Gillisia sp. Hel_I_86]